MIIREAQISTLEEQALRRFEEEMLTHSKDFTPRLCQTLTDKQLLTAIRAAMQRAEGYGFTNRGPVRLYIELMYMCGSHFDTDPQYPSLGAVLRDLEMDQMQRAETIYREVQAYLAQVSGENAKNVRNALERLATLAREPCPFTEEDFDAGMLEMMRKAFPQKAQYVGNGALDCLIAEARDEAAVYQFSGLRPTQLLVVLRFAFGHGCTEDPIYPWISRTLGDEKITTPKARAARLERKALTWLDRVLSHEWKGGRA